MRPLRPFSETRLFHGQRRGNIKKERKLGLQKKKKEKKVAHVDVHRTRHSFVSKVGPKTKEKQRQRKKPNTHETRLKRELSKT